jgi:hypothetical protein
MNLSKPLPSKEDHGDVDILIENVSNVDLKESIRLSLAIRSDHIYLIEIVYNGPIMHCLFNSKSINKRVHVDFIFASPDKYDATLMYLAYGDFSGILGVFARKLKFNYGNKGMYKIYTDKKGQCHYILVSESLIDGLKMLGYKNVIHTYNDIQNNDDIVKFIGSSDLFDSSYLVGSDLNRGDRKRLRSTRPSARECRNKLIELNKSRIQMEDDYYFKLLFSEKYTEYLAKCKAIEDYVPPKSKYGGDFIKFHFPEIKPGPIIGKIKLYWLKRYGDQLDNIDENQLISDTSQYISENTV